MEVEKEIKSPGSALRIQRCQESLTDMYSDSNIFLKSKSTSQIQLQDVKRGSVIGRGTFGQVRSLTSLLFTHETSSLTQASTSGNSTMKDDNEDDEKEENKSSNDPMSNMSSHQKYVLKEIRGSIVNQGDETTVDTAAIDLVRESRFLQLLSHHENIVSFHSTGGCEGSRNFFIIMEKINKTLDDLIEREWKPINKNIGSTAVQKYLKDQISFCLHKDYDLSKTLKNIKKEAIQNFLILRFTIMEGIASGLTFLHDNNVLFRDLKPSNIGFNNEGVPLIFDFGLARELKTKDRVDEKGNYKLTKMVGSLRYMSEEVYRGDPYGLASDVHSFSLLFYEALALEKPFLRIHPLRFQRAVFEKKKRPKINKSIPKDIRQLLERGWHPEPTKRPSAKQIGDFVKTYIAMNK